VYFNPNSIAVFFMTNTRGIVTPSGSTHASAPAQQQTGQESHQWPSWTKGIRRRLRGHDQGSSLAEIEHISAAAAATSLASDTVVNTVQETEEKLQRAQKNTGLWHILKGLVKWSNRLDNIQDRIKTKLEEYHSWLSNYKPVIHRHVDQTDSVVASSPSEAALLLLDLHQIYQKTNNVASSSQVMLDIRLDSSRKDRLRRLLANCGAAVVRDPLPFYLFVFYRVPRDVSATARIADEIAVQSLYKTTLEKLPNPGPPRVTHFDSDANDRKKYCLDGQTVVECGWLTRATSPTTSSRSTGAPSPPAILHFAYHIEQHRQPAADREPAALDYWSSFAAGHTSFCLSY